MLSEFVHDIYCYGNITVDGYTDVGDVNANKIEVQQNLVVDGNILPKQSENSDLGSSQKTWNKVYTVDADVRECLTVDSYSNTDNTTFGLRLRSTDQNNLNYVLISGNTSSTASSSAYSDLEFRFVTSTTSSNHNYFRITTSYTTNGDIVTYPSVNGKWDLGKVSGNNNYKLNRVYANEFIGHASTATGLKYTNNGTRLVIEAVGNNCVVPNGNDIYLGDSTRKFKEIHTNKVYTDEVHSDYLYGLLPATQWNSTISKYEIQIGCIFLGIIHCNTSGITTRTVHIGDEITNSQSDTYSIYGAYYDNSNGNWDRTSAYYSTIPEGAKCKLLSSASIATNRQAGMANAGDALALMMRIS